MIPRLATTLLVALLAFAAGMPAATRYMSIDEVKPGMEGMGKTVFEGTRIDDFTVRIIGVLRNTNGPKRDLILARLDGGPLAKAGVIAGMSGSPVYINGRLIGAVSYSLGQFPSEPIAGITPIEEMIAATAEGPPAASPQRPAKPLSAAFDLKALVANALNPVRAFASSPDDVAYSGAAGLFDRGAATTLRPIATPLVATGFDARLAAPLQSYFERAGFVLSPGGSAGQPTLAQPNPPQGARLRPGDPLGVALISGDLSFGATGTVTEVDGDRVYAFGHPFYNVGPARFTMTRAYVHAVLPSLMNSLKLTSIGEAVGVIRQDRATGVAGLLGPGPRTIPVRLVLNREGRERRSFAFDVADDAMLTPLLIYTALFNTFSAQERDYGAATYALRGRIQVRGHSPVELDEIYVGDQPGVPASAAVVSPLGALITNDREPVTIEGVELTIDATERPRAATIERVWIDATSIRPGRTVPLKIHLRTWRGDDQIETLPIPIPLNAEDGLSLLVSDGPRMAQWEQREGRPAIAPDTVDGLITRLNDARHANRIYVRLMGRGGGAIVASEAMPGLPASVLAVMDGDRAGGSGAGMQQTTIGSWEIRLPLAISGQRTLPITLDGRR
jgi:hypothetical protein